ncbi:MAG TPA: cation diffusion facilitator family transporter [Armatimonadota bacterium]|nr:cation diffusion facilitator family transporter [Armatimonadota bacterium]
MSPGFQEDHVGSECESDRQGPDQTYDHRDAVVGHSHFAHADTAQKLVTSIGLTLIILAAEVVGGFMAHSLALLSDAAHMVTDVAALALAWYAQFQANRPPTERRTYGYHRAGIMAALVNAVTLIAIAGFIGWEAINRIRRPVGHIHAPIMFGVALVALLVNLGIARMLGHSHSDNLNVRSVLLHVLGDAAASAGVIVGGIIIAVEPRWTIIDPILSIGIALIIVWGAWQILVETTNVLMEGAPAGVDIHELEQTLTILPGVQGVHHLHVWSLCPGRNALSGHIVIDDQALSQTEGIRSRIQSILWNRYQVDHATIQFEHEQCGLICTLNRDRT